MLPEQYPHDFFVNELKNSLQEQQFIGGIKSFRITSSANTEAIAQLTLLEGQTVEVVLTGEGYKVE